MKKDPAKALLVIVSGILNKEESKKPNMLINEDCRYFRGDIPCKPHKREGVHCEGCNHYDAIGKRILIIKLGAIGDVIRTTPLLRKLKELYPTSEITWLTLTPAVVPSIVDRSLGFELKNIVSLMADHFDLIYNFDKDREAIALAEMIRADKKAGFCMNEKTGKCAPSNTAAQHKWLTGLFDDVNRANTKSYPQELFELCGFEFSGERYILDFVEREWNIAEPHPLVGLNTGCGARWTTRNWSEEKWITLAGQLKGKGYGVILLGGEAEHEKNKLIASASGAAYAGHFPLNDFISLVNQCDLVITAVTMTLHIAIALIKKIVLLNNIFNSNEFDLYGPGKIVEPEVTCKGCFKQQFDSGCGAGNCMDLIGPEMVLRAVLELEQIGT